MPFLLLAQNDTGELPEWAPDVSDVAILLLERLGRAIDNDAAIHDTFTAATRPTFDQVEKFIQIAVAEVQARVRVEIIEGQQKQAHWLVAYRAANLAELSRVPGGSADDQRSVAPQYTAIYLAGLTELVAAHRPLNMRLA